MEVTQRILVIEDSRTQAERLRLLLTGEGYEVEVASTGAEGLVLARQRAADLVISDVTMPEMDGLEFCRAMKSSPRTDRVPIILLTAKASPADIINGLESGADNFIPKTYDDEYLLGRIRRIFEQLERRGHENLEMEVNLTVGRRKITVNADRQQIMELLFSTFDEVSRSHDQLETTNRELERARREADRANTAKSEFLSRMSHELRTPLNAVIGFGQLLDMSTLSEDDHESVRQILAAGRHLLELINEVLDIGRIDAGELTLSVEPVPVGEVLKEAVDLVRPLAAERNLEMNVDAVTCDLYVMADRQRLRQVVLNLLSNAVKYNRDGGTVTVSCHEHDEFRTRIEVGDTGPGIAEENLERLFAPFDRIGVQDNAIEGTGLGLALSRRLVDAMGGALGVESAVGSGSMFWIELPPAEPLLTEPVLEGSHDGQVASAPEAGEHRATVVYVDDNRPNLALVERLLAVRPEIDLFTATDGRTGLDVIRQHRPDAILLDLNLPDLSGEEVLTELQADAETAAIPVVIVTADASKGQAERLTSMGASGYVTKPFDVQDLLDVVDRTLTSSRAS